MHAGHNQSVEEKPVDRIIAAQKAIVEKIKVINPDAVILVAKVIESGKLPKYSSIPDLNRKLEQLVSELCRTYSGIFMVDQAKKFDWLENTIDDKVHPNVIGADKMAQAF